MGRRFKAIGVQCGVFNLAEYPQACHGNKEDVMIGYTGSCDEDEFALRIKDISPHYFVQQWCVPVFIIHALDDSCVWFGQAVQAYNMALQAQKQVQLMLVPGGHTYQINERSFMFKQIIDFFNSHLKFENR